MNPGARRYESLSRYTKVLSVVLGYRDEYTLVHSERVYALSERTAMRCRLTEQELAILRAGAVFHDIGKIGTPDRVLLKPASLDGDEIEEMKKHPVIGEDIIASTELEGAHEVANVIRHHHEFYDGSGYPDHLRGEDIPVCSRIIGIADSYDAMALTRPYRRGQSHRQIVNILRDESGAKHDPDLLRVFLEAVEGSEYRSRL